MLRNQHIEFGRHSQIPECCIQYFVTEWDKDFEKFGSAQIRDPFDIGYVRCPNCIKIDKRNKVHKCSYNCRGFLESIGRTDLAQKFKKPKPEDLWVSINDSTSPLWASNPWGPSPWESNVSNVVIQNDPPTFRGIMHPEQMVYIDEMANQFISYEDLANRGIGMTPTNTTAPLRDDPDRT